MLLTAAYHTRFLKKKKSIFFRLLKDYLAVQLLGKNRLRTIDFCMTYKCNSKCVMCSAKALMSNLKNWGKPELTPGEIIDVWRQGVTLGACHINLTGGEPTLRSSDELVEIISGINEQGALISMVTNSIALTKENLGRFVDAGLDILQLSLESMNASRHDAIRQTPCNYIKVMQVLRWAQDFGLTIVLNTVVTRYNFKGVGEIINFAAKENAFVCLNPISGNDDFDISCKKQEYYQLFSQRHVRADTVVNFRGASGCPAGIERIYITPYGKVLTCPHVQISYGDVREEGLEKIYRRISRFPKLRSFERDCRHVFNKAYREEMIEPLFGVTELPVSIYDHPVAQDQGIATYLKEMR